ncbi:MAG: enoyl-CoA hydratase/isomerase family protein [Acidimicrobiia bacterium]|nr:enoyl-CoA hydratase/isomerase family protein [Acidimicrobiia bacterium]
MTIPGGPLRADTAADLARLASELSEDRDVRVVTLRARSSVFCEGPAPDLRPTELDVDPAASLARLRPPVVVAVTGDCRSVGLELILAADIRLCDPGARFGFPDLAEGRLPCWGGTQRLGRAIRPAEATAMILLGSDLDADRAHSLGLVHAIDDDPGDLAQALAQELATRGPLALELAKEAVHRGAELPLRDGLRLEGDLNHQLAATDDRAEGLAAFFDKRPPDFAGR